MSSSEKARSERRSKTILLAVLGGAYFFSNFHRLALGVLSTPISADMNLTSMQLGTLGSAIFYSYAIMQIPCGLLADWISARALVTVSCLLTAISTIWFAVSSSFASMVLARVLTGASTALVYVPALAVIRKKYGDESFGSMTGVMVAMGQCGSFCAAAPLKLMNDVFGWKASFIVIGIITVALSIGAWILIPGESGNAGEKLPTKKSGKAGGKLFTASVFAFFVSFFLFGGCKLSFQSLWANMFFTAGRSYSAGTSSVFLTFISIGCIFGALILGKLSDKFGSVKTFVFGLFAISVVWCVLALLPEGSTVVTSLVCVILGIFGAGNLTVGFSCVKLFADKERTGTLTGINNCFAFMGSAVFTQFCGAYMVVFPVAESTRYSILMYTFCGICLVAAALVMIFCRKKAEAAV